MTCLTIKLSDDQSNRIEAVVLWVDQGYRIGIAWGSDAEWVMSTAASGNDDPAFWTAVDDAITDYFNDSDAWEARN